MQRFAILLGMTLSWVLLRNLKRDDRRYTERNHDAAPNNGEEGPALFMLRSDDKDAYRSPSLFQARRQANWTRNGAVIAGIALVASSLAVVISAFSFLALKRDQRPWIGVHHIEDNPNTTVEGIWLENGGKSVAFNVRVKSFGWSDGQQPEVPSKPCSKDCDLSDFLMLPGFIIGVRIPKIGQATPSTAAPFHFGIRVDYSDADRDRLYTEVCFIRSHDPGRSLQACPETGSNYAK